MAPFVFNVSKGKIAHFAQLLGNSAIVAVPLEAAGLEADAILKDYDTLADILAGTNVESPVGRITLTGVTEAPDDVNDRVNMDSDNIVWSTPPANDPVGAVILCYVEDVGVSTDAEILPMSKHDVTWTPDGNDFQLTVNDFARAEELPA